MNGLQFERYVAKLLRAQGLTVYRSAASRGCADLVVSNDERQYLTVQCKKHGRVRYVRESGGTTIENRQGERGSSPSGSAAANDVPAYVCKDCGTDLTDYPTSSAAHVCRTGPVRPTGSVLASTPSVGSPASEREDEEA